MRNNKSLIKKSKKWLIFSARAICAMAAGLCLELGTSYFGELINVKIGTSSAGSLISVGVVFVLFAVYFLIASKVRPIRSIDNDMVGFFAILAAIFLSFSENFLAEMFDVISPSNISCAVLCVVLGAVFIGLDVFGIDKLYEKIEIEVEFIFNKQITDVTSVKDCQCIYNKKIAKYAVWSVIFVLVVAALCVAWITHDLWWRV